MEVRGASDDVLPILALHLQRETTPSSSTALPMDQQHDVDAEKHNHAPRQTVLDAQAACNGKLDAKHEHSLCKTADSDVTTTGAQQQIHSISCKPRVLHHHKQQQSDRHKQDKSLSLPQQLGAEALQQQSSVDDAYGPSHQAQPVEGKTACSSPCRADTTYHSPAGCVGGFVGGPATPLTGDTAPLTPQSAEEGNLGTVLAGDAAPAPLPLIPSCVDHGGTG